MTEIEKVAAEAIRQDQNEQECDCGATSSAPGVKPVRVQLRRINGWRLPPNTRIVSRPSRWGNPSYVKLDQARSTGEDDGGEEGPWFCGLNIADRPRLGGFWFSTRDEAIAKAVELFRWRMTESPTPHDVALRARLPELRGMNLACWCPLNKPCHADVLLELANEGVKE
jgi:hypothetical protein